MSTMYFKVICNDNSHLTTEGVGENLAKAESDGKEKIDKLCSNHGGIRVYDRAELVRSPRSDRTQNPTWI